MSDTIIKDVPYRRWGQSPTTRMIDCKEGKRVMALMFKSMKDGLAVEFWQNQPINPKFVPGETYDTISLTITGA